MKLSELHNKKIAIAGFGIEGQAAANFLRMRGLPFAILDSNEKLEIPSDAVRVELGKNYLANLTDYDIVIRSPGIRPFAPEFVAYKKNGGTIETHIKLFFDNYPHREHVIGITGTKGKGTTTMLTQSILQKAGLKVRISGNIGSGILDLLNEEVAAEDPWIILELSSFQLQDCEASPHIAVVLMVTSEHLNYHANIQEYVAAKASIGRYQTPDDCIIINADYPNSLVIGEESKARKYLFSTLTAAVVGDQGATSLVEEGEIAFIRNGQRVVLGAIADLALRGHHNTQNVCAAALIASQVGVSDADIWGACRAFGGYEHRLQLVATQDDVQFYNDSAASAPDGALAAVDSFQEPTILFAGGSDKGIDSEEFGRDLAKRSNLKAVIALGVIGKRIAKGLESARFTGAILQPEQSDKTAYDAAFVELQTLVEAGDVVVLSPGAASLDMFENYKKRGEYFTDLAQRFVRNEGDA